MFNEQLLTSIGEKLKAQGNSVAVAESVTSGLLQCAFSNIPEASFFYQGGVTAYNIGQKCRHLFVDPLHALACNCVSQKMADDLAVNVCSLFTSSHGIGIVGYAAPLPEKNIHSLFAYYAIAEKGKIVSAKKINADTEEGFPAQLYYAETVLKDFLASLN